MIYLKRIIGEYSASVSMYSEYRLLVAYRL